MEPNRIKALRRIAKKYGVKFNRVNKHQKDSGYRIFTIADFAPVAAVEGVDCNRVMTLDEVADFLFEVETARLKAKIIPAPAVKI